MRAIKVVPVVVTTLLILISCSETTNSSEELKTIVEQLKQDSDHQFLKTLRPSESDIKSIFATEEAQELVLAFSNSRWDIIDQVDQNSMKPTSDDATLVILYATKDELINATTNNISEDYMKLAAHLNDAVTLYGIQYLNADGTEQKKREAFFKVNEKWVLIPRAFAAFE